MKVYNSTEILEIKRYKEIDSKITIRIKSKEEDKIKEWELKV